MLGVVLCGGQSTRMGTDKGLLKLDKTTWAQVAADKISAVRLPVVLSVNAGQFESYAQVFTADRLIPDNSTLQIRGPLCGVLSVHLQYPSEDLLILGCDMPLMESLILKELLNQFSRHGEQHAFVFTDNGGPEPLCGIYTSKGLDIILQLYHTGQLTKHSMKFMLEHFNTHLIPMKDEQEKYFRNFNTHAALNGL